MSGIDQRTDVLILTALRQACSEDHMTVAEHLLCALEALEDNPEPGSSLAQAYACLCDGEPDGQLEAHQTNPS